MFLRVPVVFAFWLVAALVKEEVEARHGDLRLGWLVHVLALALGILFMWWVG
jgi:hypothetical protein